MGKNLALLRFSATRRICGCGIRPVRHYFCPLRRGCSSVVEHLLAKEDVASSSLVTRSSLCLSYGESEGWNECAVAPRRRTALSGEATAGKPLFLGSLAARCYPGVLDSFLNPNGHQAASHY